MSDQSTQPVASTPAAEAPTPAVELTPEVRLKKAVRAYLKFADRGNFKAIVDILMEINRAQAGNFTIK